jgi:hypothetical protein
MSSSTNTININKKRAPSINTNKVKSSCRAYVIFVCRRAHVVFTLFVFVGGALVLFMLLVFVGRVLVLSTLFNNVNKRRAPPANTNNVNKTRVPSTNANNVNKTRAPPTKTNNVNTTFIFVCRRAHVVFTLFVFVGGGLVLFM